VRRLAAALALLLVAGCAAPLAGSPAVCPAGTEAATVAEAYFGRNVQGRAEVSDAEWEAFLAEFVTPAFPDGLTALDAAGQWRGPERVILRERSKLLVLVLPAEDVPTARTRLQPVEQAWKQRFQQQSVLTAYRAACIGF
jgi:hypothetical protein